MSAQRYTHRVALERMSFGRCPECGRAPEGHSGQSLFWLRDPNSCSLLPRGVEERIAQYRADKPTT